MYKNILFLFVIISSVCIGQIIGPKITSPKIAHDFGKIKQGDTVSVNFQVFNNGDEVLKIGEVLVSCGCTAALPEKKELAPGESTNLKVTFNSAGKSGKQVKQIAVNSNDPKNPVFYFSFTAVVFDTAAYAAEMTIIPRLVFTETVHDFGSMVEGRIGEYVFNFSNQGRAPLEIKKVIPSCGCTVVQVSKNTLLPGEKAQIKVDFDSSNKSGKTTRTISVESNDPNEPFRILTISAVINK